MKPNRDPVKKTEWRIKQIPFRDPYAMMETNWGAMLGALLFIVGCIAALKIGVLILISIFGLVFGLLSTLYRSRSIRKNWQKVSARCVDKEWGQVLSAVGQHGGVRLTWTFQLLCEFEFNGKHYAVTPSYWSTFISERRLKTFLDQVISSDGSCQLWINPENPLQAELVAHDFTEFLLH